jgi:hypothetical protein
MCLIVVIKSGIDKYDNFVLDGINRASKSNTDGIGFTFKRKSTGKVFISKGYKNYEDFLKVYKDKKLLPIDEVLVHLRIGNKGEKSVDMNHPFVISNDRDEILLNHRFVDKPTLVHNGTFFDYSVNGSRYSDTFFFIERFMSIPELQSLLIRDQILFKDTFSEIIKTNKIGIIFPGTQKLITIGNFVEDQGYLFSNISYKEETYSNVGGVECYNFKRKNANYVENQFNDYKRNLAVNNVKVINRPKNNLNPRDIKIITWDHVSKFKLSNLYRDIYYSKSNNNTFIHNFCDSIYVPLSVASKFNQYNFSKFNIKSWNYKHFTLISSVTDSKSGLVLGKSYKISKFDEDRGFHVVSQVCGSLELHKILLTDVDIYEKTTVHADVDYCQEYEDVYKILCTGDVMSKNQYKKLDKFINKCYINGKFTNLNWKAVSNLNIISLEILFNYNLEYLEEYNSSNSKSLIRKVQDSEKLLLN